METTDTKPGGITPETVDINTFLLEGPTRNEHERNYRTWVTSNPQVFELFLNFADELRLKGRRFGVPAFAERVRWEITANWDNSDGYKVNNNFRPYIARDLVRWNEDFANYLSMRSVEGEDSEDGE